jgi:hypothetical protein
MSQNSIRVQIFEQPEKSVESHVITGSTDFVHILVTEELGTAKISAKSAQFRIRQGHVNPPGWLTFRIR